MKKILVILIVACFTLVVFPTETRSKEVVTTKTEENIKPEQSAEVKALLLRLDEIKLLDKSDLTRTEKKELRTEVKTIKSELREMGGGIYISVGAAIIIILLLIILL